MTTAPSHDSGESNGTSYDASTSAARRDEATTDRMSAAGEPETAQPTPARYKLPKAARMPAGGPYTKVFQQRTAVYDATISLNVSRNGLPWHRLGLGVAKKMFRKAVARNRAKRLIREAFRLERPNFGGGLDMVVRPKVRELSLEGLRRSLRTLVPKAERKFGPESTARTRHEPEPRKTEPETPPEVAGP